MVYYVYILYNTDHDKFYIGQTYSLTKRIAEHKAGKSSYTSRYGKWLFVYYEKLSTRAEAMRREKYFKSLKSKEYLKKFIKEKRCRQ
jgi:putative endonuclease